MQNSPEDIVNSARTIDAARLIFEHIKGFDTPWGVIQKGEMVDTFFAQDIEVIRENLPLDRVSSSVALGEMKPGSFHTPYIRHAAQGTDENPIPVRVYKIVAGSFTCVRNGQIKEWTGNDGYVVVHDFDIFSFKAGNKGCIFAIIDFPAFDLSQDAN